MPAPTNDPYLHDKRPVVSVVLASGSFQGRLVAENAESVVIENRDGDPRSLPASAVERVVPLSFPDPKVWGKRRPAGPVGREVIMGAEG